MSEDALKQIEELERQAREFMVQLLAGLAALRATLAADEEARSSLAGPATRKGLPAVEERAAVRAPTVDGELADEEHPELKATPARAKAPAELGAKSGPRRRFAVEHRLAPAAFVYVVLALALAALIVLAGWPTDASAVGLALLAILLLVGATASKPLRRLLWRAESRPETQRALTAKSGAHEERRPRKTLVLLALAALSLALTFLFSADWARLAFALLAVALAFFGLLLVFQNALRERRAQRP